MTCLLALQLQEFNIHTEYVPDKSNVVADMLSRPACPHGSNQCEICAVTVDQPTVVSLDFPTKSPKQIRDS